MPRGDRGGFTGTIEWRIAMLVAWKYRAWAMRNQLHHEELAHDLLPASVAAVRGFDSALSSSMEAHVWVMCKQQACTILNKRETQRRHLAKHGVLPDRGVAPAASLDIEQREVIQLAMAAMNPRDREIVTQLYAEGAVDKLAATGRKFGVSGERIRQRVKRAIKTAREALRAEAVRVGSTLDECWR